MKRKFSIICGILLLGIFVIGCGKEAEAPKEEKISSNEVETLTYMGHASVKIKSKSGKVIYIDPYYSEGDYSEGADYILVTHEHDDHNKIDKCTKNENCTVIRSRDVLKNEVYQKYDDGDIKIEAVPAGGNKNHSVKICVGYIITVDGVKIYHAGDTSKLDTMNSLKDMKIDYALFPIDGDYNMDAKEATEVANIVGAKNNIPIHENDMGDTKKSDNFTPEGKLVLEYGESIKYTN